MTESPDSPDPAAELERRRALYWELGDFGDGHGLEIGPLHRALVPRDQADVSYLDVRDRAGLVEWYDEMDPDVVVEDIPEVDYFLIQPDGRTLTMVEAAREGAPFDWVVASHVVEHIPDLIGWLAELAELVADDGRVVLAVPDRRFTFDAYRPLTTVGQMVQAHLDGDTRPSTRAVYDHYAGTVDYNHVNLWRGERPFYDGLRFGAVSAEEQLRRTLDGDYVDSHVWLFTPDTFLRQLRELRLSGRSEWFVDAIVPTPRDEIEFRVRLRRVPRGTDATVEDYPGEIVAEGERPEWVEQQASWHRTETMQDRITTLETLLELSQGDGKLAERRAASLEAKVDKQNDQLAKLRTRLERSQATVARLREAKQTPPPAPESGALGKIARKVVRRGR
jgi:SAM-dependent methyltransferase